MWYLWLGKFVTGPALKFLAVAGILTAVISGIFFLGYSRGTDRGFDNAYDQFQRDVIALNESWVDAVATRDFAIIGDITNEFNRLQRELNQYLTNEQRERELLRRLDVVTSTLQEMQNESRTIDFGECTFSPEFERLLDAARNSISRSGTP